MSSEKNTPYKFTPEETRAIRECNTESFWYRCVPFGVASVLATQLMVNRGILKPHPRFGALWKNLGAALVAYAVGKISYVGVCQEKLMQLENSPMGEKLRNKNPNYKLQREGDFSRQSSVGGLEGPGLPSRSGEQGGPASPRLGFEDYSKGDIDTDRNVQRRGLDDSFQPSVDRAATARPDDGPNPLGGEGPGGQMTYEDLRKKNREEYERKIAASAPTRYPRPAGQTSPSPPSEQQSSSTGKPPAKRVRVNKYGDPVDE